MREKLIFFIMLQDTLSSLPEILQRVNQSKREEQYNENLVSDHTLGINLNTYFNC